jgi:serine/arginine repetitive matrix protein 2
LLSESSGGATPPLCASESGGSQSSIDTQHLDALLTNATRPSPSQGRLRPRGQGHRRGRSQISSTSAFSSIITIEEETQGSIQNENMLSPVMNSYGAGFNTLSPDGTITRTEQSSVYIVQEEDEETGEVLRKYWALMTEADAALAESQVVWPDTPFSMYALQSKSYKAPACGARYLCLLQLSSLRMIQIS